MRLQIADSLLGDNSIVEMTPDKIKALKILKGDVVILQGKLASINFDTKSNKSRYLINKAKTGGRLSVRLHHTRQMRAKETRFA